VVPFEIVSSGASTDQERASLTPVLSSAFIRGLWQCCSDPELRLEGRTYKSATEHLAYLFDIRP
jgi:hypothetical protein